MNSVQGSTSDSRADYLSDIQHRFLYVRQGWGELGIDKAASVAGQAPAKLRIANKEYDKGIGHHAPGEIIVDLNGEYDYFEAEIGVQWQGSNIGSVVFQVFVDDEVRYDSGLIRETDEPKHIRIPTSGASELRLVVTDGGDGITCDCANWADAKLISTKSSKSLEPPTRPLDVAQFGTVVTSDPNRKCGTLASRIQEFPAEDVFLEQQLNSNPDGTWTAPYYSGTACIGLVWVEDRRLKEIGVELSEPTSSENVSAEYWVGQSWWQGEWKPLTSKVVPESDSSFRIRIDYRLDPALREGTRKIRWLITGKPGAPIVRRLWAFTNSRWGDTNIVFVSEISRQVKPVGIKVYNGAFVSDGTLTTELTWNTDSPLQTQVRYSKPRPWKSDRTVLRFNMPDRSFGVAVDDLMLNGCVYVREAGVFVSCGADAPTLEEYKKSIEGRKTILQRVRQMPDQTLSQALAKTRNPVQSMGPAMVSLACDNLKFVVTRDGAIQFPLELDQPADRPPSGAAYRAQVAPAFGRSGSNVLRRYLHNGWLPAPVIEFGDGNIKYTQRSFVTPFGKRGQPVHIEWLSQNPLCVSELTIENPTTEPADVLVAFEFLADRLEHKPMGLAEKSGGVAAVVDGRLVAFLEKPSAEYLQLQINGSAVNLMGKIAGKSKATCRLFIPGWKMEPDDWTQFAKEQDLIERVESYWNRLLSSGMRFEVPDEFLRNLIRASIVYCLVAARNEENGLRIAPWIASMAYGPLESEANSIIMGMCLMGFEEFTRRSLDFFIHRYSPEGYLTTGYTLVGTGWHLWSLGKFYELYRDEGWMRNVAPEVAKVCNWITAQREKTKRLDPCGQKVPEYGLVPPGVLADWGLYAYHYCLEGYYYAGLKWASQALAEVGHPDGVRLAANAEEFRKEIRRAYYWTQSAAPVVPLRDGTWVPSYPAQVYTFGPTADYYPGQDANRSWAYDVELGAHQLVPQGLLDPASREVEDMINHMEDVQFLKDGWHDYPAEKSEADWFNLGGFAKMQPYYCRNAEIYALRNDVKPFVRSYFNTLASLVNTETMWFWEHFNNVGAWNKTHETGYFLQQTRFMLVMEHGDELWLAPLVTNNWMKHGMTVAVTDAPTKFGTVSYQIVSRVEDNCIEATIYPPKRMTPRAIVLRIRHPEGKPMRSIFVNGIEHNDFDVVGETVRIADLGSDSLTVRVLY
ncbi:MAG: NPCBM/NEW2 domain-containing protein [Armatimonadota bacterium]|nr:NPCBM/NEW2 domain-containing protein [Armatimonadota bacterium]